MTRTLLMIILSLMLAGTVSSCASRGKLRTPSQILQDEQKKAAKIEKAKQTDLDAETPVDPMVNSNTNMQLPAKDELGNESPPELGTKR